MADSLDQSLPVIAASLDAEDSRVAAALRDAVEAEPDEIHATSFVLDSLRAALWAVLRTTTFEDALIEIVNRGGDCDAVGAVAGALAGARYGAPPPSPSAGSSRCWSATRSRPSPTPSPSAPTPEHHAADARRRLSTTPPTPPTPQHHPPTPSPRPLPHRRVSPTPDVTCARSCAVPV